MGFIPSPHGARSDLNIYGTYYMPSILRYASRLRPGRADLRSVRHKTYLDLGIFLFPSQKKTLRCLWQTAAGRNPHVPRHLSVDLPCEIRKSFTIFLATIVQLGSFKFAGLWLHQIRMASQPRTVDIRSYVHMKGELS